MKKNKSWSVSLSGNSWVAIERDLVADRIASLAATLERGSSVEFNLVEGQRSGWEKWLYKLLGLTADVISIHGYVEAPQGSSNYRLVVMDDAGVEHTLVSPSGGTDVSVHELRPVLHSLCTAESIPRKYVWKVQR